MGLTGLGDGWKGGNEEEESIKGELAGNQPEQLCGLQSH